MNSVIGFTRTIYAGTEFENVRRFQNTASGQSRIQQTSMRDLARMRRALCGLSSRSHPESDVDILFDEIARAAAAFTAGRGPTRSPTTATASAVHWDMVLIQRKDWGGGEIWIRQRIDHERMESFYRRTCVL